MSKNLLKGFAAVAMLCMIGAVFATPVALGDLGGVISGASIGYSAANGDWVGTGISAVGAGALIVGAIACPPAGAVAVGLCL